MLSVKHFTELGETADGPRVWVEPIGITRDLCEWCHIDVLATEFAPPAMLWEWLEERPGAARYLVFRRAYRDWLQMHCDADSLRTLAELAASRPITLLHQGGDPRFNTAGALRDLLEEMVACRK